MNVELMRSGDSDDEVEVYPDSLTADDVATDSSKSHWGMCFGATVVFISFVATGGFAAGTIYTKKTSGITPALSHLTLASNTSASFCEQPWEMACGGFADQYYKYGSTFGIFQRRVDAHLQRVLDNQHRHSVHESKASEFYALCLDQKASVYTHRNQTAHWFWQRGFVVENVSFGRTVNPLKEYETLPYVQLYTDGNFESALPRYVQSSTTDHCGMLLFNTLQTVMQLSSITSFMVYGNYDAFCQSNTLNATGEHTTDVVSRTPEACLRHTSLFWHGYLSVLTQSLMPATHAIEVQYVFAKLQAEYMHQLKHIPVLRDKIAAITCETSYSAPVESYAYPNASFYNTYFDLRRQLFERQIHSTSIDSGWHMEASTVNAYYNCLTNKLYILPAMAMYLYDSSKSTSLLYGRLGFIIAHEIAHSIETNGILFDKTGRYTAGGILPQADKAALDHDAKCIENDFETNGRTLNEDMADHLGIAIATSVVSQLPAMSTVRICAPDCLELNAMAQFYMYFSQTFCNAKNATDDVADVHSPGHIRVMHALTQTHAGNAFGCTQHVAPQCTIYNI
tara:strand:- start:20052 stop:21749 length:1698 start_codon:yes stop_codon:yes gene_type:complete